jgi:hypothetical protein
MESDGEEEKDPWTSHPFLRLYEKEESRLRSRIWLAEQEAKESGKLSTSTWSDPRIYVVLRFFHTIEGFHEVSNVLCALAASSEQACRAL